MSDFRAFILNVSEYRRTKSGPLQNARTRTAQEIIRRHKEAKWGLGGQREERDYRITKWAHEEIVVEEKERDGCRRMVRRWVWN